MEDVEPITLLKKQLFYVLRPRLQSYDFVLDLKRHRFSRRLHGVTDVYSLVCLDASPGYRIEPDVSVRLEQVEAIFHETSGFKPNNQNYTATWGVPVNLLAGEREHSLTNAGQVEMVADQLMEVFREHALPFYERWGSLPAIDTAINANPHERVLYRSLAWFRCSTGLITARLTGRPDYAELFRTYTEIMKKDKKGFYHKWFEPLTKSLERIPPGSGLMS